MAEAAIFNIGKNVNNFGLDKDVLKKIISEDAPRPCGDNHVTKSRNRKLIRVTSSNERLEHNCVDLSDYKLYLNQMLYRAEAAHYYHEHDWMFQIYMTWKSKMVAAAAILDLGKCQ